MRIGNLEVYGVIYKITNTVNKKVYIGQTTMNFKERYNYCGNGIERVYNYHTHNKISNSYYNKHLLGSIEKYGVNSFDVNEVIDIAFSKEELDIKEQCWITIYNSYKNGYNNNKGGMGNSGFTHTEESKLKIRKSHIGKKNPMYGKHILGRKFSKETKIILSIRTKEQWKRMGHPKGMLGKKHSEETKKKFSESRINKGCGKNNPHSKKVICITTDKLFNTLREGSVFYNTSETTISKCCKGIYKSSGKLEDGTKLEWMYYEDYLKNRKLALT